jgi:hypothetical protein
MMRVAVLVTFVAGMLLLPPATFGDPQITCNENASVSQISVDQLIELWNACMANGYNPTQAWDVANQAVVVQVVDPAEMTIIQIDEQATAELLSHFAVVFAGGVQIERGEPYVENLGGDSIYGGPPIFRFEITGASVLIFSGVSSTFEPGSVRANVNVERGG